MISRATRIKIVLLVSALIIGGGISYYFFIHTKQQQPSACQFLDFDDARDTAEILNIFTVDRYWLLSSPDYDPSHMLSTRSPNKNEEKYKGKLKIKVMYKNGQFMGFTAYYLKNFIEGMILFLAVKPEHRGQRCGPTLIEHALAELKKMGVRLVTLVTRVSNVKAQAVYKRTGFTETNRDQDYVYYAKEV